MKIVEVNPFYKPYMGGIENHIHEVSSLLTKKGHDVTVLTGRLPGTEEEEKTPEGYRILRLESGYINLYNPPYMWSHGVLEALRSIDADVVNYNYRWAPSYNKALDKYDGAKVHTVHNTWNEGTGIMKPMSTANDKLFWNKMMRYDRIITVSNNIRDDLIRRGAPADKVVTVPTCGHVGPCDNRGEEDFILSVGRLVNLKGIRYLIEAMRKVDSRLVICGKGPEEKKLRKQIAKLGLQDKVEMRGFVSEEEKKKLLATCKMVVMPSLFEAFGLVAVESMTNSKPIVCTNVNGLPETVGEGGLLVNPRDPDGLADAINRLLADDDLRHETGLKARKQAEYYDWSNHIDDYEKVLTDVVRKKSD